MHVVCFQYGVDKVIACREERLSFADVVKGCFNEVDILHFVDFLLARGLQEYFSRSSGMEVAVVAECHRVRSVRCWLDFDADFWLNCFGPRGDGFLR
jgi:hypothetical protein